MMILPVDLMLIIRLRALMYEEQMAAGRYIDLSGLDEQELVDKCAGRSFRESTKMIIDAFHEV